MTDMNGFTPGDSSCSLRRYGAIVAFLDAGGTLSEGDRADLEVELLESMGACAQLCLSGCMASTFLGIRSDSSPHTRHPNQPNLWAVDEILVD